MASLDLLALAAERVGGALGQPDQQNMLPARELQAMSFIVHIPLVCFGIALPGARAVAGASTAWLALGIACMFGFIVCGVFLIASPSFLEGDEER